MVKEFGDFESGRIRILTDGDEVTINVHWPFDRETDEWIDATGKFERSCFVLDPSRPSIDARDGGTSSEFILKGNPTGPFDFRLKGRNSLHPVEADLRIPEALGLAVFGEITSILQS